MVMCTPQADVFWVMIEMSIIRAHYGVLENATKATLGLFFTAPLRICLTALQAYEYTQAPFTITDLEYGSTFFIAVGFHGLPMQKHS